MNAIFTIVAKNYIGLAQVLEQSVKKHHTADYFIIVADEFESITPFVEPLPSNVLIGRDVLGINPALWNELSFKYNLVEFCTSIKPAAFQYFFNTKKYEKVVFVDPDVYFFNSIDFVFEQLSNYSIILTPHILQMQKDFTGDYPDYLFLSNGTFNLGFLALSNTPQANRFLDWWHNRLSQYCFFDNDKGMATDQKWINMLPSFFSNKDLLISFHKGMNVAPWNFHERQITLQENGLYVTERNTELKEEPLIFVHFSGYNYRSLLDHAISHKNEAASEFPDYQPVFNEYAVGLKGDFFTKYIDLKYSYNYFKNGINIISLNRRLYRRLLQEGEVFVNPFEIGKGTYFALLKQKRLLDSSKITADQLTNKTMPGFHSKIKFVHLSFTLIKKMIGVKRYSVMLRFFRRYFTEENQAFLLDKKYGNKFQ
jgi:hypothetical protein